MGFCPALLFFKTRQEDRPAQTLNVTMKIYLLALLFAATLLVSCKKDDEVTGTTQISTGRPVTPEMYAILKGTWRIKNKVVPPDTTTITFINDTLVFFRLAIPTDTFVYELKQLPAVNSIHMRNLPGHPFENFEQYFLIKEDNSFWLVPDGEMERKS